MIIEVQRSGGSAVESLNRVRKLTVLAKGSAKKTLRLSASGDRIVLLAWGSDDTAKLRNVVRVDQHGTVRWRAELPARAARDCYVRLGLQGDDIVATTYSEWAVHLDAETGAALSVARNPAVIAQCPPE